MNKQIKSKDLDCYTANKGKDRKDQTLSGTDIDEFAENIKKIDLLSKKLSVVITDATYASEKREQKSILHQSNTDLYSKLASKYFSAVLNNPSFLFETQANYYKSVIEVWSESQKAITKFDFKNDGLDIRTNPFLKLFSQQYEITIKAIKQSLTKIEGMTDQEQRQFKFLTEQLLELFSPDNFFATNPNAIFEAVSTKGKSLINGMSNLIADIEKSRESFQVSLVNEDAFTVGKNIAKTPGSVVYENSLFQLIHYKPTLSKTSSVPLVIVPPCINKYYNLDLQEKNSFVKFTVDQGIDVFLLSWINPDRSYFDVGLEDYIRDGILNAFGIVKKISESESVNALGYCIGGTLLATTLSYMKKINDRSVKTATFFTTLTDFEEVGDLSVFLNQEYTSAITQQITEDGVLGGEMLSQSFNFLRSKDLIFSPARRSYLMGKKPPAFDILYWNGDKTNLPGKMALEYLDLLYKNNLYSKGRLCLLNHSLTLSDIEQPIFSVAARKDHIAPWKSCFKGLNKTSGEKTFILAESGHIAGVINPHGSEKYGYCTIESSVENNQDQFNEMNSLSGSWWGEWSQWLKEKSGSLREPPICGKNKFYPELEPAPGRYVMKKY